MTPHELVEFDLALGPFRDAKIAGDGTGVTSWRCLELPAGTGATVRTGRGGPRIPIRQDDGWEWDPCSGVGPETQGIWFDTPAAAVGVARFVVYYGGGGLSRG